MVTRSHFTAALRRAAGRAVSTVVGIQSHATSSLYRGRIGGPEDPLDLSEVRSVLVVRLDEIGDGVMFTPFLRELRRLLPQAHITLVVKPANRNLIELCPYVSEVLTYSPQMRPWLRPLLLPGRALRFARKHLRHQRYDLAVVPRWETDSWYATYVAFFSGARWRVGFSEKSTWRKQRLNRGFDRLLTHAVDDQDVKHQTVHNLDLITYLGGDVEDERLELWLDPQDEAIAAEILADYGACPGDILVGLGLSGGHNPLGRQWPLENFTALARWIRDEYRGRVVLVGGRGEEPLGEAMQQALGPTVINAIGKTTLRQMAALLKRCDAYVGNDSGPMHVASAMGTPVVAIFGSTCWHRSSPWGPNNTVIWHELSCSPCHQGHGRDQCGTCRYAKPLCINGITVEQVQQAVRKNLDRPTPELNLQVSLSPEIVFDRAVAEQLVEEEGVRR